MWSVAMPHVPYGINVILNLVNPLLIGFNDFLK
jgi:hypothetical protein